MKFFKIAIKSLSRVLSNKDIEVISPKLRMIAVENFDWEIRAKQMVAAYQNLSLAERTIFPKECVITYQKSILPASE